MAVKSNAFGRVTLTGDDAKKFKNQVTYGKPKAAAKDAVIRGVALAERFRDGGRSVKLTLPTKK